MTLILLFIAVIPFWLGPLVGVLTYRRIHRSYRNQDKRHDVERATRVGVYRVDRFDRRVSDVTGTRSTEIDGRNDHRPWVRVRRFRL